MPDGELWAKVDLEHKTADVLVKRTVSREEQEGIYKNIITGRKQAVGWKLARDA